MDATSPFNPYLGIMPLLLCPLAVWGVLAGHHRQLWVAVFAGSVAAQTHLGNVLLVAALLALTSASLAVDVVRSSGSARRRLVRQIIPVGLLIGALAWIGPIIDQLFGSRNLTRLLGSQSGDRPASGFGHGIDVAVEMTSLPPRWLLGRARDQDLSDPGALRIALSLAAMTLVVAFLVWAVRHRDRGLASLAVVSLVAVAVATATSARLVDPVASPFFIVENAVLYRLFWWPVALMFSLTVVWGSVRVGAAAASGRASAMVPRRLRVALVAGVVAGLVLLSRVGYVAPDDSLDSYFRHELANAEAIAALPGSPETVVLRFEPEGTAAPAQTAGQQAPDVWSLGADQRYGYAVNLVAQLRLRGIAVRFADEPDDGVIFMRAYRNRHRAEGDEPVVLLYRVGAAVGNDPPPGYRIVSVTDSVPGAPVDGLTVPTAVYVRS